MDFQKESDILTAYKKINAAVRQTKMLNGHKYIDLYEARALRVYILEVPFSICRRLITAGKPGIWKKERKHGKTDRIFRV